MKPRFPPILQLLAGGLVSWGITRMFSTAEYDAPVLWYLAIALLLFGFAVLTNAVFSFVRQKTTVNPLEPQKAERLVITGLYRFTRNPMYLGLAAILIGFALILENALALLGPLLFVISMTLLQIIPEERALSKIFGDEYHEYKDRVRRWI